MEDVCVVSLWYRFNVSRGLWVVRHVVERVISVGTCICKELRASRIQVVFDFKNIFASVCRCSMGVVNMHINKNFLLLLSLLGSCWG